jgi:hypothetical protein
MAGNKRLLLVVVGLLVVCFLAALGRGGEDDEEVLAARALVLKMADGDAEAMKKGAAELVAKKVSLKAAMIVLRLRTNGGVGVGDEEGTVKPDGIEAKIVNLQKRELTAAAVKKEGPALEKAAKITLALSYVADAYTPPKKIGDRDPKDWTAFVKEMRASAEELATAAKKADPKAIKAAATRLTTSCGSCHFLE